MSGDDDDDDDEDAARLRRHCTPAADLTEPRL